MSNTSPYHRSPAPPALSRRDFLWQAGGGLGGLALASLLGTDRALASPGKLTGCLHHPPKAKRVVQFFMAGAASHLDLYDYKPELIKRHGQPSDFGEKVEAFQNGLGPWMRPFWDFRPYGRSGKMLSEVSAPLGAVVDDMAFIHNMVGKSGVHSAATLLQSTGFQLPGFPGAGCWVSYALGSENDNLPTFVVLPDHRGFASNGVKNWDAAFLPSQHSGTIIQPGTPNPVADLFPGKGAGLLRLGSEPATQALLAELNQAHAASRPGDQRLEARIRSYELAARMQLAAPEALDLQAEPTHVQKLYGLERGPQAWAKEINEAEETFVFGQRCLAARRLLERGVRFVQVWSGNDNGFPGVTGIPMRTLSVITGRWHSGCRVVSPLSSRTSSNAACLTTLSSFGRRSSAGCPRRREGRGAIIIPLSSPIGWRGWYQGRHYLGRKRPVGI